VSKEFARNCKFIDTGHVFLMQKGLPNGPLRSEISFKVRLVIIYVLKLLSFKLVVKKA